MADAAWPWVEDGAGPRQFQALEASIGSFAIVSAAGRFVSIFLLEGDDLLKFEGRTVDGIGVELLCVVEVCWENW